MLHEDGSRVAAGPLPCVKTIRASVNPFYDTQNKRNRQIPGLQKLFFACPNLKSFSLTLFGNYGGCVIQMPYHPQTYSFEFGGEEKFPPLESLSLDGYHMTGSEWMHWRDKLEWTNLRSLSLGPQIHTDLLDSFTGHANALRSLTVQAWAGEGPDHCPELERFVGSFSTLEELTIKGHFVSVESLSNHPRLQQLCVHTIELPRDNDANRPVFSVNDLAQLDASCPNLRVLEIDADRRTELVSPAEQPALHLFY